MKTLIIAACVILTAAATPAMARGHHRHHSSGGSHYTSGYTRHNGTYVRAHRDTNPDHHFGNNWSTKGNTNPDTGKAGTKVTPPHGEAN